VLMIHNKTTPPVLFCRGCGKQLVFRWGPPEYDLVTGYLTYREARFKCPREHWWSLFLGQHHSQETLLIPTATTLEAEAKLLGHLPRRGSSVPRTATMGKEG
jgi:hypothetical protein